LTKLTSEEIQRRKLLVAKFKENAITREEAEELKQLLEKEKQEASEAGEFLVLLGIVFLLALVIDFLSKHHVKLFEGITAADGVTAKRIPKKKSRKRLFSILN
jgi:hypothetical protein